MGSRRAKDRASRLREFRDCDDEVRALERDNPKRSKEAAIRRHRAMRGKDVRESDFIRASEELVGRTTDYYRESLDLARKLGLQDWQKEK